MAHALQVISTGTKVWSLRLVVLGCIAALCVADGSPGPALAFALCWIPNGIFLALLVAGAFRLPAFLVPVHPIEPALYRWLGVGLVKWIVTRKAWLLLVGLEPPKKANSRDELLDRAEAVTKGAEACHGATLLLALAVAILFALFGHTRPAIWISAFNVALNVYPVLLQRSNRWRLHQFRANPAFQRTGLLTTAGGGNSGGLTG